MGGSWAITLSPPPLIVTAQCSGAWRRPWPRHQDSTAAPAFLFGSRATLANFRLLPGLYFDIIPAATFTGMAMVTLTVPSSYTGDLTKLKSFHWREPRGGETITPSVNVGARTLTFQTATFSDFGVGEPLAGPIVSTPASSVWSLALLCLAALGVAAVKQRRPIGC